MLKRLSRPQLSRGAGRRGRSRVCLHVIVFSHTMSTSNKGRLATPANFLSLTRIVAVPFIIYLLTGSSGGPGRTVTALFVAAALTDLFDGMLARASGTVTELGKVLDPLADRILIGGTIIALTIAGVLPTIGVILVVARDVLLISGYKAIERRGVRMRVSFLGKTYTALFMVAIVLLLAGARMGGRDIGIWLFWFSVAGSLLSGISYTARGLVLLRARRGEVR